MQFLMGQDVNSELSTMAKAFPGNTESVPTFVEDDELFKTAFEIYKDGYPANEFTGLPVAEELMRQFGTQFQSALDGQQSMSDALTETQDEWTSEF
ncbi:ABC-type glycerol-3-phosphate transport system substrate-binding protein [Microbacterium proteolyticum]|uniref:ABC-type glycerol-3-phosphate transport system substrate-binding protein n=2 Tax=Microbacterium proteolyticum TaxID=1572644 RepID=A0A7W5CGA3_9MICO|nr:ABC-type glycerol-3-phosphate transport system substrate-binding protein [Microbacterium proteolyticum]